MARGGISATFGKVVRKHRRERGLSQERLAELTQVHRNYVGMVERGERNATLDVAFRLANALEIGLLELIDEALRDLHRARD